jgi:hypothetical protein
MSPIIIALLIFAYVVVLFFLVGLCALNKNKYNNMIDKRYGKKGVK